MKFTLILSILYFSINYAIANSIFSIEYLQTNSAYNYFSLPNENEQNRVDLGKLSRQPSFRLFYENQYQNWSWTVLYAPLTLEYKLTPDKNFKFNNTSFKANQLANINYKFNSYRIGYRRITRFSLGRFYYGGLVKVRDAEICLKQSNLSDCYDNVGPVPLLNVGAELSGDLFYSNFNIDGLYSSQGSAYDANFELGIKLKYIDLGIGARILGGGADNEKLINFGQFRSTYLTIKI